MAESIIRRLAVKCDKCIMMLGACDRCGRLSDRSSAKFAGQPLPAGVEIDRQMINPSWRRLVLSDATRAYFALPGWVRQLEVSCSSSPEVA